MSYTHLYYPSIICFISRLNSLLCRSMHNLIDILHHIRDHMLTMPYPSINTKLKKKKKTIKHGKEGEKNLRIEKSCGITTLVSSPSLLGSILAAISNLSPNFLGPAASQYSYRNASLNSLRTQ